MPYKWEDHVTMTQDTGGQGEGDHQGEQHGHHKMVSYKVVICLHSLAVFHNLFNV